MQLIISDIGRKSFPKNTCPSIKKVLSKKMIGPLSQDVWKKFSLATTSAVSAWILTSETDKNDKNYGFHLRTDYASQQKFDIFSSCNNVLV